ncbi:probable G-protein coupled receptor 179 [Elgaria multicarinata webbii]|uniref:probable G-protein coupled receptor 179 n=1 Tax=Elgaria multicarinata webbii TaxID=159646 RepID=UPI002FCD42AB
MENCLLGLLLWCFHLELLWAAGIFQHQRSAPPKPRTPKAKEWIPSSSSSLASAFTWMPTPNLDKTDLEGSEAAVAFLYSGDVLSLSQANCTRRFEVREVGKASGPPPALRSYLHGAVDTLTHATNFLNMVFQTNDIRESSVKEDVEWYHALVRSVMEGDVQVYRAVLTFDAHPVSSKPQMMLQATKENNEILLQDLSASAESLRNLTWENEWYNFFRFQRAPLLYKRILNNDLKTLDTPKWSLGDSYVMDTGHVKWSLPYLECEDGKFLPTWMVTLSSSFYGLKPDLSPEFKGVVRMDVKIQNVDINQCASGQGWFANTHQCDLNSTQCIPQETQGFVLGRYLCLCKPGFYGASRAASSPSSTNNGQPGERAFQYGAVEYGNLMECQPCQEGCTTCVDGTPCLIQEDWSLRAAVLVFQAFCMMAVFFSMLVSYHFRKSKRIRASGVVLLETILFGSLLLYFPVFILYFKPSIFRCIVLRWVRMLGFAIVYGTITLKLYRVLKVFLSRTAQRVPYMTSVRVLKMLALILLLVLWFLAAWTVGMLENIEKNIPLVVRSQTTRGLQFYICDHDRWDYMMVVAEMLFLLWGSFLCYATRTVPSAFHEPRYMGIALHNELITSTAFHIVRFSMVPSLHPDWTLLLFFIHTHVTTTMTLALLFIPKFLHAGSPLREEIATEVYEDELDMRRSGSYLNNSITSAWSEHSLDPDDIRDELKKLYTQLEVHKTKKMTANNPHLQKKRSSKRGLGRSLMRRITEIPESMSRQYSKEEKDGSVGGGSGSRSGSYKRRHLDSGSSSVKLKEESSSKRKVALSLKKSHSTYDHTRDAKENNLPTRHDSCKEAPLLDSLMRKKLAKKASERSNSDSLDDSAPLVYKSASAHNLLADKKPLHPKPSPLQKSLSVVTSAKEKALLLTSRAYLEDSSRLAQAKERRVAAEDSTMETEVSGCTEITDVAAGKQLQADDTSEGTVSSLLEDGSSSKDTVCPWEAATAPSTPSESRSQKHVTYAPIRSVSINTSDLPGKRHHGSKRTPPEPPVRQQSLVHSLERQDIAPWDAQDQTQPSIPSHKRDPEDGPMMINTHPGETEESPAKAEMERTRHVEDSMPPSAPAGLTRLASIAAEVCPWEVMEVPVSSKKDPEASESDSQKSSPEKQSQSPQISIPKSSMKSISLAIKAFNRSRIKTSIRARKDSEASPRKSEKDAGGKSEKPKLADAALTSVGGSSRQQVMSKSPRESRAKVVSKQSTICPWDEEEAAAAAEALPSPSKALEVCPWEVSQDGFVQGTASSTERMASKSAGEISPIRLERANSQRGSVCPWETIEEDQNREDKTARLPPVVLKTDSKKAEACPWDVADIPAGTQGIDPQSQEISSAFPGDETAKEGKEKRLEECKKGTALREAFPMETPTATQRKLDDDANIKASICPWEISDILPEKSRADSGGVEGKKPKSPPSEDTRDVLSKKLERESSQRGSVCPWENASAEVSPTKPAAQMPELSKVTLKASSSGKSKKVEVCPWETETAEVCPWEVASSPSERGMTQVEGAPSKGVTMKASPEDNRQHDSVCPWEDIESEDALMKPSDPRNTSSKKSDSSQSKKAEIAPWEAQEADSEIQTAICPWESDETPTTTKELKKDASAVSKEEKKGTNGKRELVTGSEDSFIRPKPKSLHRSKGSSKKSDRTESQKATVCPWETERAEVSTKAEICPWEVPLAPSDKSSSRQSIDEPTKRTGDNVFKPPAKVSSPREPICPWETVDIDDLSSGPSVKTPGLSKVGSRKSSSIENLKTEVCPWESQETEPSTKADVCPWEMPESPVDKSPTLKGAGALDSPRMTPLKQTGHSKTTEKMSSPQESLCPWESVDPSEPSVKPSLSKIPSKKSDSAESLKAEVCPWEVAEETVLRKGSDGSASPVGFSKAMEKLSTSREDICPWESMELEEPWARSSTQSPALSKAGSKKSDSAESLRAEVCPWETAEEEESSTIEMCPWTAAMAPFERGKFRQDPIGASKGKKGKPPLRSPDTKKAGGETAFKKIEKSKSHQESVCPWESMDFEKPPAKSTRSLDLLQVSSKKSESVESLKAEVCPWEFQELQTDSNAERGPWAVAERPPERKDKGRVSSDETSTTSMTRRLKREENVSSPRESVCPWESLELLNSQGPDLPKAGSEKSDSVESLRAEVCPWEVEEEDAGGKMETPTLKAAPAPANERAVSRASKGQTLKSSGWMKVGGETISKKIEKTRSHPGLASPRKDIDELSAKPSSKSLDLSKVDSVESDTLARLKAEVCPWETQVIEAPAKADVCAWDLAVAPLETFSKAVAGISEGARKAGPKGPVKTAKALEKGTSCRESVCPWESTEAAEVSVTSASAGASSKKSDSAESRKSELCPWETSQPEASPKEEICPWEAGTVLPAKNERHTTHSSGTEMPMVSRQRSQSKQEGLAGHRPLCRSLADPRLQKDFSKGRSPPVGMSAKSGGESTAADPTSAGKDSAETRSQACSELCPWEAEATSATSAAPAKSKAGQKSQADEGEGPSKAKSDICPWDCD